MGSFQNPISEKWLLEMVFKKIWKAILEFGYSVLIKRG